MCAMCKLVWEYRSGEPATDRYHVKDWEQVRGA
jgi:rubredoxin